MQLKEIYNLLLEGRTSPLTLSDAQDYYQEEVSSVWSSSNTQIFRGNKNFDRPYGIVHPSEFERKSENTDNYYTLLMDNMEEWKKYPKRSESIVCTSHYLHAKEYGIPYLVLPLGNIKFGIAPEEDIWGSFDIKLNLLNSYLNKLSERVYGFGEDEIPDNNISEFREAVLEIDRRLKSGDTRHGYDYEDVMDAGSHGLWEFLYEYLNSNYDNLYEYIKSLLDPEKNGFEIKKYGTNFKVPDRREVWTDGPCLLVAYQGNVLKKFFGVDHNWDRLFGLSA